MKLVTLKSFLCCMSLETGGFIISTLHLVVQGLGLLFGIAFLTVYDCYDFERMIDVSEDRICLFYRGKDFIAFNLMLVTFSLSFALLPYWCIKAIRNRSFTNVKPFMWFLAVIAVCSMYDLVFFTWKGLGLALVKGVINGYMFYVIYSLHTKLRDEPKPRLAPEFQPLTDPKTNSKLIV